ERARELRKNATRAEAFLWELLRNRQLLGRKFRRQHPIGRFIADFFCDDARLIIEIDGAVHQEPNQQEQDRAREEVLRQHGYHLLRFTNEQVLYQTVQVLRTIGDFVLTHSYETPPSPEASGEEGRGDDGANPEFARAVVTYLALAFDRLAAAYNSLCRWQPAGEKIADVFSRQALPMVWDFAEPNPFGSASRSWDELFKDTVGVLTHLTCIPPVDGANAPAVQQGSATRLPWPDNFFDAVLTDPPYYDNVNYSALSDFFYVWLKRIFSPLPQRGRGAGGEGLYPDLFATPLTPKSQEIVQDPNRQGGKEQAKAFFEQMLTQAFREIHRVLKPEGIAVIVFAHKTTEAWETVINALLEAGLYMTASWPIHTEMQSRLNAQETASLASSIYMVCRKRPAEAPVGEYPSVRREIEERIRHKLTQFWDEGIRGADFFMSAIGPAVEAFGKYARVEKLSGEPVTVAELLEYVRKVVAEFALSRILHNAQLGGVDALTRFYLLWRWTYNHARVPFDEARKLASGVGVELTEAWLPGGLVQKEKEYVRVLSPQGRGKDSRFARQTEFATMVDALQRACILWEKNRQKELHDHLAINYGANEVFWQVAQAISEVLPEGDREKQALQGLLYGRKSYRLDQQRGLFEEQ
ncbi:MAG: DUF559 domain-containing protein, partial [candidate division KSB1 bacterium]|nr:DUF559 domain-containing protein [candidate division KSB1 bacterium]